MMKSRHGWGIGLLSLWMLLGLIPFLRQNLPYFSTAAQCLLWIFEAAWFWWLMAGLGTWVLKRLGNAGVDGRDLRSILTRWMLSIGMGAGLFAALVLATGTFFGVSRNIFLVFLVGLVVLVGCGWRSMLLELRECAHLLRNRPWNFREWLGISLVLTVVLTQLPAALTPTIFPDTLRYHFGLTRLYEQAGAIIPMPHLGESNISSNWQMIYMPQLLLDGEGGAMVFNWMTLPLAAVAVGLAAGAGAEIAGALILVSTPFLLEVAGLGNNDLGPVFFMALMFLVIKQGKGPSHWLVAGILGGFAVGTKYNALMPVAVTLLAWFWIMKKERTLLRELSALMGCFIGYLPWFLKNLAWMKDPFYPLFSRWISGADGEGAWICTHYAKEMARYGSGMEGWPRWLLAPWRATIADGRYFESDPGVIFWCAIPVVIWTFWKRRGDPFFRIAAIATGIGGAVWAWGPQVTRFLGPLIPAAAIAAGGGWREMMTCLQVKSSRFPRGMLLLAGVTLLGVNVWQAQVQVAGFSSPYEFLSKALSREEYLLQYSPAYRMARWTDDPKHAGKKILLIGEDGVWFFQNHVQMDGAFNRKWISSESGRAGSAKELAEKIRRSGVDLLVTNLKRMDFMDRRYGYMTWPSREARLRFDQMLNEECRKIQEDGEIQLFEWNEK